MLFDDEEISGRRLSRKRNRSYRNPVLNVRTRRTVQRQTRMTRVAVFVLVPVVLLVVGLFLWLGLSWTTRVLLSENGLYEIKELDIRGGTAINQNFITGKLGIRPGLNLFAFDIRAVRREFLRRAYNVKSIEFRRHLPGRLVVEITERHPLARVGRRGPFVTDRDGIIFPAAKLAADLPTIDGYRDGDVKPGSALRGMGVAALQVLDACDNPKLGLRVVQIDANNPEHLVVHLSTHKKGRLAWDGMFEADAESRERLLVKLCEWARVLQTDKGRRDATFDLTYDGRLYGKQS